MSTILVTGGAGFIGSHLCEALLIDHNMIIVLDSFNDFYSRSIKMSNIDEIKKTIKNHNIDESLFKVIKGDIRDRNVVDNVFLQYHFDIVIHLAAYAGVRPSIEQPLLYYDVNVMGTLNILEAVKKNNTRKLIFASSSSVYGNNEKIPFNENDFVDNPISPYAATKKAGELMCYTYSSLYDIKVACLRFFTVYGPRQRPDLAIYKFTEAIYNDLEIPFYGDGETKRDYTYIDDIIHGITQTIHWIEHTDKRYQVLNLGESKTISLEEMVETLEKTIGKKARIKRLPNQLGDVQITNADITKSRMLLDYNPKTQFEDGIESFIKWFTKRQD